jgi:hypothetical protein
MSNSGQHQPIEYVERDCGVVTTFELREAERMFEVEGLCPACQGRSTTTFNVGVPQGYKGIFRQRKPGDGRPRRPAGPTTVYCACGYPHATRPADSDEVGCGAHWKVKLP